MSTWKKPVGIAAAVVVALLLILIITPFFINADTFRPQIEQALSHMLGRKVEIGHLRVSLLQGSLVANQISIADDPAYSHEPFLTARSLAVGVDLMPLLFSHALKVHSFTFDGPHIQLLRDARGDWNFASLGGKNTANSPPAGPSAIGNISIDRLAVTGGTIAFGRAGEPTRQAYDDVNITARNVSTTRAFPLQFDAKTPGGGSLHLQANAGPLENVSANYLPFQGQLSVNNVPAPDVQNLLAVLGYSLPQGSSLQAGTIQANLQFDGPLDRLVTSGPVKLSNVRLAGFSLPAKLAGALGQPGAATGNDTVIQLASSNVRYSSDGVRAEDLKIMIQTLGTLTGSGTVGADNSLNFHLVVNLAASSPLAQLVKVPMLSQGGGGLPFHIAGTTSHPVVVPDMKGIAGTLIKTLAGSSRKQQQGGIGGILGGLLGKKTP
ncbi:MAG TPA: AsmA family protein [Candidatus Dormibacteraeota bacterium]|nr:AsmA family protein [Candidatus Dormibacteraeota bacterium]